MCKNEIYVDVKDQKSGVTGTCQLFIINFPGPIKKPNTVSDTVPSRQLKFIVDCGLFQGEKTEQELNYDSFDFDPTEISFALLTHAHVDHYGRFPKLSNNGFINPVFMTKTTGLLLNTVALADCMRLTKKQAKRSHKSPLYTEEDMKNFKKNMVLVNFNTKIVFNENISFYFFENGHLPGAATILLNINYPSCKDINLFFTGDYINRNVFFPVSELAPWVKKLNGLSIISESTYGTTQTTELPEPCFVNNVLKAINEEKRIVFLPTFSLGRTQEILFALKKLQDNNLLSTSVPIYLDGLTAQQYTLLFASQCFPMYPSLQKILPTNLQMVNKPMRVDLIKDLNCKIIISSSGMITYGPAQFYTQNLINCPYAVIHLTGYASPNSVAGKLKNAAESEKVTINGVTLTKKAKFLDTAEWSAHAKADELLELFSSFNSPKSILLHHGEQEVKDGFADAILKRFPDIKVGILSSNIIFRITADGILTSYSTDLI